MKKQREALGELAKKVAGEAQKEVQQTLDQLEVREKKYYALNHNYTCFGKCFQ